MIFLEWEQLLALGSYESSSIVLESRGDFVGFRLHFYSLSFVLTGYCVVLLWM